MARFFGYSIPGTLLSLLLLYSFGYGESRMVHIGFLSLTGGLLIAAFGMLEEAHRTYQAVDNLFAWTEFEKRAKENLTVRASLVRALAEELLALEEYGPDGVPKYKHIGNYEAIRKHLNSHLKIAEAGFNEEYRILYRANIPLHLNIKSRDWKAYTGEAKLPEKLAS